MSAIFSWSALAQAKHQAELCWVVTGVTGLVGSNTVTPVLAQQGTRPSHKTVAWVDHTGHRRPTGWTFHHHLDTSLLSTPHWADQAASAEVEARGRRRTSGSMSVIWAVEVQCGPYSHQAVWEDQMQELRHVTGLGNTRREK